MIICFYLFEIVYKSSVLRVNPNEVFKGKMYESSSFPQYLITAMLGEVLNSDLSSKFWVDIEFYCIFCFYL